MTKRLEPADGVEDRSALTIEVTEEMIEAGALTLADNEECSARLLAKLVYQAMEACRQ